MSNLRLSFIMLAVSSFITASYAQSFSFQTNTPVPQTQTDNQPAAPLSPDDFKQQVQIESQKSQQALFQETDTELKKEPAPNVPEPIQSKNGSSAPSPIEQKNALPAPPEPLIKPEENNQTTTTTTTKTPQAAPSVPVAPAAPVAAPAATPPAQSQIYTGFGGGSPNNTAKPAQPSSPGGGWNIKY